jgi:hypothetical protein
VRPHITLSQLSDFLESGISVIAATRDALMMPDCVRAVGARVEAGGAELSVFLPEATASASIANLRENGRIAIIFSRPRDHRSFQVKGRASSVDAADAADRAVVDRYRASFADELAVVGLPPRDTLRIAHWPCWRVRIRPEAVFVQTPGPGAGAPLRPGDQP